MFSFGKLPSSKGKSYAVVRLNEPRFEIRIVKRMSNAARHTSDEQHGQ